MEVNIYEIIIGYKKNVAKKIRLIKEILVTDEMLDSFVRSNHVVTRRQVAEYGRSQDLDVLINDKDWLVRFTIAEHNRPQDLEILKNDADPSIAQYAQKKLKELKK